MADGGRHEAVGADGQGNQIRLDRLPPEMILAIMEMLARLDYESLVKLASVSRKFRTLAPSVRANANFDDLVEPAYRSSRDYEALRHLASVTRKDFADVNPGVHRSGTTFQSFINGLSRFPRLGNRQEVARGTTEKEKVFALLRYAVLSDNLVLVQQFLPPGAEAGVVVAQGGRPHVELTNDEKHELIGEALYQGFIDIVTYLGNQPWFDPNYVYREFHSKFDVTPLFIAKNQECVAFILERGADAMATDRWGETPLFADYTRSFTADMISDFINAGVDVNHNDNDGDTALASHVRVGSPDSVIEALLENGANPLSGEGDAKSALQIARERRPDLVNLLQRYTAGRYHGQVETLGIV